MSSLVILPLILFYQHSNWTKRNYLISLILVPMIWLATYALLHETSHLLGAYLVGCKVTDYRLIPEFWKGDFSGAWISPICENRSQEFVVRLSPDLRSILFLIVGWIILKRQKSKNSFIVGLILVIFVLGPLYDIVNNFSAYIFARDGDFNGLSKLIGNLWTYAIGLTFSGYAIILTVAVLYGVGA